MAFERSGTLDLSDPTAMAFTLKDKGAALDQAGDSEAGTSAVGLGESVAQRLGIDQELVTTGPGVASLFEILCRETLGPGDRVAIAEPTLPWVKQAILDCGAAYVDVGRTWDLHPQQEALERILDGGDVPMVFLPGTCPLSGVECPGLPSKTPGTLWVWDHTFSHPGRWAAGSGELSLVDLGLQAGLASPVAVAIGSMRLEAKAIQAEARAAAAAHMVHLEAFVERLEMWQTLRGDFLGGLGDLRGLKVSGRAGPGLMLRHPDLSASQLSQKLNSAKLLAGGTDSHIYHDHVVLRVPHPTERDEALEALRAVWGT